MNITGENFIGNSRSAKGSITFQAENPALGISMTPDFHEATAEEVTEAIVKAEQAFWVYRKRSGAKRAKFLESIADEIMSLGDELIKRCCEETGLPEGRIMGERGRTVNQLKLFAKVLKEGSWVDARIDHADPQRQPVPKPDVRSYHQALGPVGIFGASNFPLAFSVAGGDTASALAAGCTVVVKGHPSHPGASELVASAIVAAIKKSDMPDGTFSLVQGPSVNVGMGIVNHPLIKAIGFTGSYRGGKAIFDTAAKREEPIPVYAEMGSTNPVFVLPGALSARSKDIAEGLAASVTLGVGQFCTNPGIVVHEASGNGQSFLEEVAGAIKNIEAGTMLSSGIKNAYEKGVTDLEHENGVAVLAKGIQNTGGYKGTPYFLQVEADQFLSNKKLEEEVFGPSTLAVKADNRDTLLEIAKNLRGHLTATLFANEDELAAYQDLIDILERKVGRLIINAYPTGVEVCHAMVHGGPFPATTDSKTTSVGTAAIHRFTRPVCYQNFPAAMLPDELKDENPGNIWRLVDGEIGK